MSCKENQEEASSLDEMVRADLCTDGIRVKVVFSIGSVV